MLSDPELAEVLRLSLEQAKRESSSTNQNRSGAAPANGTALAGAELGGADKGIGGKEKAVPTGVVEALASEKCGRWFSFDDRKVLFFFSSMGDGGGGGGGCWCWCW